MPFPSAKDAQQAAGDGEEGQEPDDTCLCCNQPVGVNDYRRGLTCSYVNCPGTTYHDSCMDDYLRKKCKCGGDRLTGFPCPATLGNGQPCPGTITRTHHKVPNNQVKKQKRVQAAAQVAALTNKEALEAKRAATRAAQAAAAEKKAQQEKSQVMRLASQLQAAARPGPGAPVPVVNMKHKLSEAPAVAPSAQQLRAQAELLKAQIKNKTMTLPPTNPGKGMFVQAKDGSVLMNPTPGNAMKAPGAGVASVMGITGRPAQQWGTEGGQPKRPPNLNEDDFPAIPGATFVEPSKKQAKAGKGSPSANANGGSGSQGPSQSASKTVSRTASINDYVVLQELGNGDDDAYASDVYASDAEVFGRLDGGTGEGSAQDWQHEEGYYVDGVFVSAKDGTPQQHAADWTNVDAAGGAVDPALAAAYAYDAAYAGGVYPDGAHTGYGASAASLFDGLYQLYDAATLAAMQPTDLEFLHQQYALAGYDPANFIAVMTAAVASEATAVAATAAAEPAAVYHAGTYVYSEDPAAAAMAAAAAAEQAQYQQQQQGQYQQQQQTQAAADQAAAAQAAAEDEDDGEVELDDLLALCMNPAASAEPAHAGHGYGGMAYNPPAVAEEPVELDSLMELLAVQ